MRAAALCKGKVKVDADIGSTGTAAVTYGDQMALSMKSFLGNRCLVIGV